MAATWITCAQCKVVFQSTNNAADTTLCSGCASKSQSQVNTVNEPGWYYAQNKQKHGPVPRGELDKLAASGQLKPTDMVLQEGSKTWMPAANVTGLFPPVATPETVDDSRRTGAYIPSSFMATLVRPAPATTSAPMPTVPGYELLAILGRGGMGVVYKARHVALKRIVALKMILAGAHAGSQELARFRIEAEAVARLQHPNIVQVYEIGDHEGRPFLSLEFVEGGTLGKKLAGAPQPPREAARLLHTLALAMEAAHQRGIVHRDLKPGNVLLAGAEAAPLGQCVPKIVDFGLAKQLDDDSGQTQTGAIMGTPSYMAPEQAGYKPEAQARGIGPAPDVYALGSILYELLTGRPPFRGATLLETLEQVRTREPVSPRDMQPSTPLDLETICLKCLQKEPGKRYPSAKELADDLDRYLNDRPIAARPASAAERTIKFARRHKLLVGAATAVIAVLLLGMFTTTGGMGYAMYQANRAGKAEQKERERGNEVQAKLLEVYEVTAQLRVQQGDLKGALELYDRSLKEGAPNVVPLRLGKARALMGLSDPQAAEAELDDLVKRKDLGRYEGEILLLKAEIILGLKNEEAFRLIRQALSKGLPKGQEQFAKALLAERSDDAAAYFRQAIAADHYHHRARIMLGVTLIILGRVREAEELAMTSRALYREDPNFLVLHALTRAFQGDVKQAVEIIGRGSSQFSPDQSKALKGIMPVLALIYTWDDLTDEKKFAQIVAEVNKAKPVLDRFFPGLGDIKNVEDAMFANDRLRPPPLVARNLQASASAFGAFTLGKDVNEAILKLDQLTKTDPSGTTYFFLGTLLMQANRPREAEEALVKAMELPSLMNLRGMSLVFCATCIRTICLQEKDKPDLALRARGVKYVEQRFRLGPVRAREGEVLIETAAMGGAVDLARVVLADWEKAEGVDRQSVLRERAVVEFAANNYPGAIQAADAVLQKKPDDNEIKELRADAIKKLREFNRANGL